MRPCIGLVGTDGQALSSADVQLVFGNIEVVALTSRRLLDTLVQLRNNWRAHSTVGDVLAQHLGPTALHMYVDYVKRFDAARKARERCAPARCAAHRVEHN